MKRLPQKSSIYNLKSIRWRITLLILLVITVHLASVLWITKQAHINANKAALEKVKGDLEMGEALLNVEYPGPWQIKEGKLYKGNQQMNGNITFVDYVGRLTGDTCTIFQGDTRVATNVIRNGSRAVGTKVSSEVQRVVLEQGQDYFGEAEVVGAKYQTAYKPIKDTHGKNIGIWYAGASNQYVDNIFINSLWNVGSTISLNLILIMTIIWLLSKFIVKPIRELAHSAIRLGSGDLDTEIRVREEDEIGYLAKTFEEMRVERKKAEEELRAAHQQLLDIIEFLPDATFVVDKDRKVIAWNRAIEEMTGVAKEKIIGTDKYASVLPFYNNQEQEHVLIDIIFSIKTETEWDGNSITEKTLNREIFLPPRGEGDGTFLLAKAGPLFNNDGKLVGAIKTFRDITHSKLIEGKLRYLATHDSLTGAPNRLYFEESMNRAIVKAKEGQQSAILFIDLDNFKLVNDTLGHDAGDRLLISLIKILKNNLQEDELLARFGGDEFAVLLEGASSEQAMDVAEKLRCAVDETELCLVYYKLCFNISLSIGIAMIDGSQPTHKLLSLADTAMYRAKESGRNKVVFLQEHENEPGYLTKTNYVITLVKNALKSDRFILHYQPVVSSQSGRVIYHEVLVRLKDENDELIYPGKFIPIAERFGLMNQIDRWVVKKALEELSTNSELTLFVNLSGVSLGDEALLEYIEKVIHEKSIDPFRIGFEITETVAIKDLSRAGNWIQRLKSIGCQFALDDFGIGFSSFSYLKILPVDYIKIDGSFIRNLHKEKSQYAFVKAINTVAQTLAKKTIAEFVEDKKDLEALRKLNIDYAQGYYVGKPVEKVKSKKLRLEVVSSSKYFCSGN